MTNKQLNILPAVWSSEKESGPELWPSSPKNTRIKIVKILNKQKNNVRQKLTHIKTHHNLQEMTAKNWISYQQYKHQNKNVV